MTIDARGSGWEKLMRLVTSLESKNVSYSIMTVRPDALMVTAVVPGERWEIEVFGDGHLEIEVFRSAGQIFDEDHLLKLWILAE
jgi:hypothetical protein